MGQHSIWGGVVLGCGSEGGLYGAECYAHSGSRESLVGRVLGDIYKALAPTSLVLRQPGAIYNQQASASSVHVEP